MICKIIAEGKRSGLLRAYFTGGEPFLRKDLAEIVGFCKRLGVAVELWTNGTMLPDNIDILRQIDCLTMSLDGSETIHDNIRGKGSFALTICAAELAKKYKVHVSFNFTLTSRNINSFIEAVNIASSLEATIGFQPVCELEGDSSNIRELFPSKKEFHKVLNQAFRLKKKHPYLIENSFHHLDYLKSWPILRKFSCLHGKAIFTVLPDATLVACTNNSIVYPSPVDLKNYSLKKAISYIRPFQSCACACYGAYDGSSGGSILPVSWEVFNFHVMNKWKPKLKDKRFS